MSESSREPPSSLSPQTFEELLQAVSRCSVAESPAAMSECVGGVDPAIVHSDIIGTSSSAPHMFSFLMECSRSEFFLEGILAVSVASIDSPFWFAPSDGLGSHYSVKDIVSGVVNECIQVLEASGAKSEATAMSITVLGRKLGESMKVKLTKDQKLRDVLQGVAGVVLCGDLQSRSGPSVYFAGSEATASHAIELPSGVEPDLHMFDDIARLRESSDLAAAVLALLHLWCKSPKSQSDFQKMCQRMWIHPNACIDVIQRANALLRSLLENDGTRTLLLASRLFQGMEAKTITGLPSNLVQFPPIQDHKLLLDRASAWARRDSAAVTGICNIAASHFCYQVFEIFSAFGEMKCRVMLPDGSSAPASVPLKVPLSSAETRVGFYMRATGCATDGCVGVSCATLSSFVENRFAPLRTEIICASAIAIDKVQSTYAWPSHPGCIISRTSRMEISLFGPDASVTQASASVRDVLSKVTAPLVAVRANTPAPAIFAPASSPAVLTKILAPAIFALPF